MYYVELIVRLIVFFLSNLGYWEWMRKNTKINQYFLPSLTIAAQTSVLFAAGLLNVLMEVTCILFAGGLILLVWSLIRDHGTKWIDSYKNVGFVYLIIALFIAMMYVRGQVFTHYDNFSHWALVVKQMLTDNRYPNFENVLIEFQEYPLGSATYIYYMAFIVGASEAIQMLAQIYMMLACLLPIFIYCKRNKMVSFLYMFLATNFIFVYNIKVNDLLVDTLLPVVAACMLLYFYHYSQKFNDNLLEMYLGIFYMIQVIQIKNSGIFFIAIISIWILLGGIRNKNIINRAVIAFSPYITLLLWQKHCSYVYMSSETSKHAMTAENYGSVYASKTAEDIQNICHSMLKFSVSWKGIWYMFLCVLVGGVLIFTLAKECKRSFYKAVSFCIGIYIVYQIGMLFMYLYSMPGGEATRLASVERYCKTILIVVFYVLTVLYMKIISQLHINKISGIAGVAVIVGGILLCMNGTNGQIETIFSEQTNTARREWIEGEKLSYNVPEEQSYCILIHKDDSGYMYYLGKYVFQSNNVSTRIITTSDEMDSIDAKYILIYDKKNKVIKKWIKDHYPEQKGNDVIIRE